MLPAQGVPGNSNPRSMASSIFSRFVLFAAKDNTNGMELWRTTATGAQLVRDIRPGSAGSFPSEIVADGPLGQRFFFFANDGTHGEELWQSDGTTATLVLDIRPGSSGSAPRNLVALGGTVAFVADDGVHGAEPWVSDGTASGTRMLRDIRLGAAGSGPNQLTATNRGLVFAADDGVNGQELWISNGVVTSMVADISVGAASSSPGQFAEVNGLVLFAASNGSSGRELWSTDGTSVMQLVDIAPGTPSSSPDSITATLLGAFFTADDGMSGRELWRTDGTASGTHLVRDIRPGPEGSSIRSMTSDVFQIWFVADDGVSGPELWRSDGILATLVQDLFPGTASPRPSDLCLVSPGRIVFAADSSSNASANDRELWSSDGSSTVRVMDISPGIASSSPTRMYYSASLFVPGVFFAADNSSIGLEPWRTDGLTGGTVNVADIASGPGVAEPYLDGSHDPVGNTFTLCIHGGEPNAPGVLVIGSGPLSAPITGLPFLAAGYSVRTLPQVSLPFVLNANGSFCVTFPVPGGVGNLAVQGFYLSSALSKLVATDLYSISLGDASLGGGRGVKTVGRFRDDHLIYNVSLRLTGFGGSAGTLAMYFVSTEGTVTTKTLLDPSWPFSSTSNSVDLDIDGSADDGDKGQAIPFFIELLWFQGSTPPSQDGAGGLLLWRSYC